MTSGQQPSVSFLEGMQKIREEQIGETWVTDALKERRRADALHFCEVGETGIARPYEGEIEQMIELGRVTVMPEGDRVLTSAVLPEDAQGGGLVQLAYDSRKALCHKVLAVGPGVKAWQDAHAYSEAERIKPGDFVWILATVSDRMSQRDKTCRLWTTRIEHIGARIIPSAPVG